MWCIAPDNRLSLGYGYNPFMPRQHSIVQMNKAELVKEVAFLANKQQKIVGDVIDCLTATIRNNLQSGNDVVLFDFGTFKIVERQARTGRNPRNGEPIEIQAKKAVKFTAGKLLRETIAGVSE